MEKKVLTSCPFPLIKFDVNIKYTEVKKASGIAYMLLVLIKESNNKNEYLTNVLKQFGIPQELQYIYADEISEMITLGIIEMRQVHYNINSFGEYKLAHFVFTAMGEKIFAEGAIPTGQELTKKKAFYFNPATKRFALNITTPFSPIENSFMGKGFMDKVDINIGGLEEYINQKQTELGFKKEERVISYEIEDRQDLFTKIEENVTIVFCDDTIDFQFKEKTDAEFYKKYYSGEILSKEIGGKNKFKFVLADRTIYNPNAIHRLSDLGEISNLYLPEDYNKQANRPCRILLKKGNLDITGQSATVVGTLKETGCEKIIGSIDKNIEFIMMDSSGTKAFIPLRIGFDTIADIGECMVNMLVEKRLTDTEHAKIVTQLYSCYSELPFGTETAKAIYSISSMQKQDSILTEYIEKKLSSLNDADEKIALLTSASKYFLNNEYWNEYRKEKTAALIDESLNTVTIDTVSYKSKIAESALAAAGISTIEYIERCCRGLNTTATTEQIYEALTKAGYDTMEVLPYANVIKLYAAKAVRNEIINANSDLARGFATLGNNLSVLKTLIGVRSTVDYAIKDSFSMESFFSNYSTFIKQLGVLSKYKHYAIDEFNEIDAYNKIFVPVYDILQIEKTAAGQPDKITAKYIDTEIQRGNLKSAISDMHVKLEFELGKRYGKAAGAGTYEMIDYLKDKKIISREDADSLHELRIARNNLLHPAKRDIIVTKTKVEMWCQLVFSVIGGAK